MLLFSCATFSPAITINNKSTDRLRKTFRWLPSCTTFSTANKQSSINQLTGTRKTTFSPAATIINNSTLVYKHLRHVASLLYHILSCTTLSPAFTIINKSTHSFHVLSLLYHFSLTSTIINKLTQSYTQHLHVAPLLYHILSCVHDNQ
jgi:hypothetical protein